MTTGASTRLPARFGGSTRHPSRPAPQGPARRHTPPAARAPGGRRPPASPAPEAPAGSGEDQPADGEERETGETREAPEEVPEMITGQAVKDRDRERERGGQPAPDLP